MTRNIDQGFERFLGRLTPTDEESELAKSHRSSISSRLKTSFGLRRFARIGSFGNGTSISGYSDVDYLASLSRDTLTNNSTYSLAKIRADLAARFTTSNVHVDCPAIVIPFGTKKSETTEIVPADYVGEETGFYVYDIADGQGGWMRACPDAHIDYVARIDKRLGGKLKPLIRFIKAWKYYQNVPISSFYLELKITKYAEYEKSIVYGIDLKSVLSLLLSNDLAAIQDPVGISGYISPCKTSALKIDALSKLATASTRADKAWEAKEKGNVSDAFAWYRLLYNDGFPTYYY